MSMKQQWKTSAQHRDEDPRLPEPVIIERLKKSLALARGDEGAAQRYLEFCQESTDRLEDELKHAIAGIESQHRAAAAAPAPSQRRTRSRSRRLGSCASQRRPSQLCFTAPHRAGGASQLDSGSGSDLHPLFQLLVDFLKQAPEEGVWLSTINVDLGEQLAEHRADSPGSLKRLRNLCNDLRMQFPGVLIFDDNEKPGYGSGTCSPWDCGVRLGLTEA